MTEREVLDMMKKRPSQRFRGIGWRTSISDGTLVEVEVEGPTYAVLNHERAMIGIKEAPYIILVQLETLGLV